MTIIVDFAAPAAGAALLRDLLPPDRSIVRAGAKLARRRWQDKKALWVLPNLPRPRRRPRRPPGPVAMYDAVNVANIPRGALAVAGYMDGLYVTVPALKKLFRGLVRLWGLLRPVELVTITITARELDADFLDVENGDATPEEAPGWALAKLARGDKRPGLYANRSTMPRLWALLTTAGIRRDQVKLWVADWTDEPHIPTGYDACQWHGGMTVAYDESLCLASFFD